MSIKSPVTGRKIKIGGPTYKKLEKLGYFQEDDDGEEYEMSIEEDTSKNMVDDTSDSDSDIEEDMARLEEEENGDAEMDAISAEIRNSYQNDTHIIENKEANDVINMVVNVSASVIAENLKQLSKLSIDKLKQTLKSMITKRLM